MNIIFLCMGGLGAALLLQFYVRRPGWGKSLKIKKPSLPASDVDISKKHIHSYNRYTMGRGEYIRYMLMAAVCLLCIGYIFFRSVPLCVFLSLLSLLYPRIKKRKLIQARKQALHLQFRDAIQAVSSSLTAGKSAESAFKSALTDLEMLYPEGDAYIIREFEYIQRGLEMNERLETLLGDLAERADIEDIRSFVEVFSLCRSTGGNLVEVIRNTTHIIHQKIEVKNDIDVIVAQQRLSQKILNFMPFGLTILISFTSPDYIRPLYTPVGHMIMFIVLAILILSFYIGTRIMDIEV